MVEIRFQIPRLQGNPFSYLENDVQVRISRRGGSVVRIPAFYDGGTTWRARYTPSRQGSYTVSGIERNGAKLAGARPIPASFQVAGRMSPGFVRRSPRDVRRFIFDNGAPYYPLGNNVAWSDGKPDTVPGMLTKMGRAGENWSRIWMDHWDRKNLDWVERETIAPGTLSLDVARHWDEIVRSAEKSGVYFQMVLQHHGQYAGQVNSNWAENPWNVANGGFLKSPADFFTDARAEALTRSKYRYIIARWGYSPSIMAWELFNEVQWTDGVSGGRQKAVAMWHNRMAVFLRSQDPFHHLITSSMGINPETLGDRMDYWQPHEYVPDALAAVSKLNGLALDRPAFIGEIGPADGQSDGDGAFLRRCLWGSLMSEAGGAAQYWDWNLIDRKDLYAVYRPATSFVRWSGLAAKQGLKALAARVETANLGTLTFAPGAGWAKAGQTEFTVLPSGEVPGSASMPAYLQGKPNRALFPSATFHVTYSKPGNFAVEIGQVAKAGAEVTLSLDGQPLEIRAFPPAPDNTTANVTLMVPVPAGRHTVRLECTGADWVTLNRFTLTPYAPELGVAAKSDREYAVAWVFRRGDSATPVSGRLTIPGLSPGMYRASWWDTDAGKVLKEVNADAGVDGVVSLVTPPIARDAAVLVRRISL